MSVSLFITNRYIRSGRKSKTLNFISLITIGGIAIGVAAVIIALSALDGFENTIAQKIIQFNSHIQISAFADKRLPDYEYHREFLLNRLKPYAVKISPYAERISIIRSKKRSEGVTLKGFLPKYDVSDLKSNITEGKFNLESQSGSSSILLGKKLAEKLLVKTGDKVVVFSLKNDEVPSPDNPPGIKSFIVSGIFESSMAEYDDAYAYTDLSSAQELFGMEDYVNGYDIKLNSLEKADSLARNLQDYLGYPYYVRTIYETHQTIFTWLELQKKPIPIAIGLIIIVASFNIIGALFMMVLEKTRAIGTLKSLGMKRRQISNIFLMQGIYLSLIGIALGNILAFTISKLQENYEIIKLPASVYYMSKAVLYVSLDNYLVVSGITLVISLLSAYIPGRIAARINPVNTLRFN
jgi:lipoprotein-releasing system permease protein